MRTIFIFFPPNLVIMKIQLRLVYVISFETSFFLITLMTNILINILIEFRGKKYIRLVVYHKINQIFITISTIDRNRTLLIVTYFKTEL